MSGLLSSISGQFGKIILLGTLFPVLIMSILNVIIVTPLLPFASEIQAQLQKIAIGEEKWSALALLFVVLVITGCLYNLNIPIIRLYEGYPWANSWLGVLLIRRKKKRLEDIILLRSQIRKLRGEIQKRDPQNEHARSALNQQTALRLIMNTEFPDRQEFVLPTKLGNVIRCFERYSSLSYGMDAIVLWPRLISKVPRDFASTIDDAKTSMDFMLNISFLSAITCITVIAIGLSNSAPITLTVMMPWAWRALFFFILAFSFYRFSIPRAAEWGMQIKAAIDLCRLDLLKSLGYQQQPLNYFEEKTLWQKISAQLLYADARVEPLPYITGPTRLFASPEGIRVSLTRTLKPIEINGRVQVEMWIENKDTRDADIVTVSETIPAGYKYVLNGVRASTERFHIHQISPLEFTINTITPKTRVNITYSLKPSAG